MPTRQRLGEALIDRGLLAADDLASVMASGRQDDERIGECLVRLGYIDLRAMLETLASQLRLEFVDLDEHELDHGVTRLVPADFARSHRVLPLSLADARLTIATPDPGRPHVIDDLRLITGFDIVEVVADPEQLAEHIDRCHEITVESLVEDFEQASGDRGGNINLHDIEVMASEPTVINLVNLIISSAVRDRASDVHLTPFEDRLELRYRVDGVLREVPPPPRHLHAALISRIKIMADMNIAERFIPQDGRIQIQHTGRRVDIRVGSMPTVYGESVVMRLLEKGQRIQTMRELGLDAARAATLEHVVEKPHGIFLATGPTGSGKTTSLYSVLSGIYTPEKKILTIEDPVEYELPGVAQIPVRPRRGFTFAVGLRAILRQDPDVIMVGEIRDLETAEIAIRAALTGHLVFSTLHTNDAAGAVTRLVDMGIEPFLIASSLEGVLAQRLVRTICRECIEPQTVDDDLRRRLHLHDIEIGDSEFARGAGCSACHGTGYLGRTGLYELLVFDGKLRELVLQNASSAEVKRVSASSMVSIKADGVAKARAGVTTLAEVLRVAVDQSA